MPVVGKQASIEDALLGSLATFAAGVPIDVAYPNLPFTPVLDQPYLSAELLPNQTEFAGVGVGSAQRHLGLFQVTVYGAAANGAAPTSQIADAVMEFFAPNTVIATNGVRVRIGAYNGGPGLPYRSAGFNVDGWRVVPVTIPYWCDI